MKIANANDVRLIVDNAQHMGQHKGHITTYSFENSKHISCGEGGIAITNSEYMASCMRKLSNHGFKNSTAEEGRTKLNMDEFQSPDYKRHSVVGWNYRLSEFCAAVALAQLERVEDIVAKRRSAAQAYQEVLKNRNGYLFVPQKAHDEHTFWTFAVTMNSRLAEKFRKAFLDSGGDGFYGAWSVPYREPAMTNRTFVKLNPTIYENICFNSTSCPTAEGLQPIIMQFKTNYRNVEDVKKQAAAFQSALVKLNV
jgi:perosamine synthetase